MFKKEFNILVDCGFIRNKYFYLYKNLITNNSNTCKEKFKTQKHHIIPLKISKILGIDNTPTVNLLYKDHILAHYYLCLCCNKTISEIKYSIYKAFLYMYNGRLSKFSKTEISKLNKEEIKFIEELEKRQKIYEAFKKECSEHMSKLNKGKKKRPFTEEHKKNISKGKKGKPSKNKGKTFKPHTKQWKKEQSKRSKGKIVINNGILNKRVYPEEFEKHYKLLDWTLGFANKEVFKCSEEQKQKISNTLMGHKVNKQTKNKISLTLTGYKQSEETKEKQRNKIWITNGKVNRRINKDKPIPHGYKKGMQRKR